MDWGVLVLGGLFGVALNQMLFFLGLNLTEPIHAALIMMSTPLLITIIALIILKERIGWDKGLGLLLGISGAIFLMSAGKQVTITGNTMTGDFLIFLNAASYAIYLVIIKPLMQRYRPIIVIRLGFLIWVYYDHPFFISIFCGDRLVFIYSLGLYACRFHRHLCYLLYLFMEHICFKTFEPVYSRCLYISATVLCRNYICGSNR